MLLKNVLKVCTIFVSSIKTSLLSTCVTLEFLGSAILELLESVILELLESVILKLLESVIFKLLKLSVNKGDTVFTTHYS